MGDCHGFSHRFLFVEKEIAPTLRRLAMATTRDSTPKPSCPHPNCNISGLTPMKAIEIYSRFVTRVLGCNPGSYTLHGTNTYLVGDGPSRFLIDTGEGRTEYPPLLKKAMESVGCVEIKAILCTHRHYDHIGGIPSVYEALGGPIPTYKCSRRWAAGGGGATAGGGSSSSSKVSHAGSDAGDVEASTAWLELRGGEVFEAGAARLTAIHAPGHSADHTCFLLEAGGGVGSSSGDGSGGGGGSVGGGGGEATEERALFAGDNILGQGTAWFEDLQVC